MYVYTQSTSRNLHTKHTSVNNIILVSGEFLNDFFYNY